MKNLKLFGVMLLSVALFMACSNESQSETEMNNETEQMNSESEDMMAGGETIVEVASGNQNLSTLVEAVKAAGRVEMLNEDGPYTVFAPTNAAFDKLPEGTLANLLKPENKQKLGNILAFHVVEGNVMAADLRDGQKVTTVQGAQLTVTKQNGNVMINGAKVVSADVDASNGVVHVINTVLMPPSN